MQQEVIADYQSAGLSLRAHPFSFLRDRLRARRIAAAADLVELPADRRCAVAGLILLRQRPGTAQGITFMTLEDETGTANLIVRSEIWARDRRTARRASAVIAHGRLQRHDGVVHVLVDRLEDLSPLLAQIGSQSRDFR